VRQDLEILIASREQAIETLRLERRHLINTIYAPGTDNFGLSSLLDPRNRPERQAGALTQLRSLRTRAEIALGSRFDLMAYNDFIIAQGLLPPRVLEGAVMEEFVHEQSGKSPR
jgi:hypothetical protein